MGIQPTKPVVALLATIVAAGCSGEIHRKSSLGTYKYLSIDARQRLVTTHTITDPDTNLPKDILCTEPSPNVFVAHAAAVSAGGGRTGSSGGSTNAGIGGGSSEAASGIGARTQTIELLRDAYYRACEGYGNGIIGKDDYRTIIANIDSTMIALAAIDALGGATLAGNNSLAGAGVAVTVNSADNAGAGKIEIKPGTATAGSNSQSKAVANAESAKALREIALFSLATAKTRTDVLSAVRLFKATGGRLTTESAREIVKFGAKAGPRVREFRVQ